jgi:hypothetical protein
VVQPSTPRYSCCDYYYDILGRAMELGTAGSMNLGGLPQDTACPFRKFHPHIAVT